jgi:hypothetical protein
MLQEGEMPFLFGRSLVERCLTGAESGLGIVLAVTPITLWVAWTPSILMVAVAVAVISASLLVLLNRRRGSASPEAARHTDDSQPVLPDGFVEEIHQIFPLTYHHSRSGPARFRRAMDRLGRPLR